MNSGFSKTKLTTVRNIEECLLEEARFCNIVVIFLCFLLVSFCFVFFFFCLSQERSDCLNTS